MKRFTPNLYIIFLALIFVLVPIAIIAIVWILIDNVIINSLVSFICCGPIILYPISLYQNRESASVVITESSIENYMNDKTLNFAWIEEIVNIQSIVIASREECRKYYKDCNAKKALLIDFGNGNVKYISLNWFTKRQSKKNFEYYTRKT